MNFHLRACTPDDDATQLAVYASTREDELSLTDWSAAQRAAFVLMQHRAQQVHYASHYPNSRCQLILVGEAVAGRLWLDGPPESKQILDIAILPAFRGQGLGTACLRELMQDASSLSIHVEIHNPARRLYERLGFTAEGELQGVHQRMNWHAKATEECLP